ncbi:LysR family transcriptional regulator [Paenibacillus jiagnxiensis]|uniref:LysR family transcriptional regulator n=1 Tax=Paenibacillus jiagnxiensis TaxID=3228926 RepID=UPI0033AA287C
MVELGSLTKAAEALGFTQSGISHTISSLEQEFGFPLLVRSRSGVKLTVNGKQVLQPIREILKWNEQLKQQVKQDRMLAIHSTDHLLSKAPYMPLAQVAYEDLHHSEARLGL